MHPSTFDYLKPTDAQLHAMAQLRISFAAFAAILERDLPDGPDKTYVLRHLRECGMWANVSITRHHDGTPRGTLS